MKKPVIVICPADKNNFQSALTMLKSLRKFHDWPVLLFTNETDKIQLEKLPDNVEIVDLNPYLQDPMFFYRATPILAEPLLDEYELVLKLDADQLILGDLSYVLDTQDYDVATVINANRMDFQYYGWVELGRIGIAPMDYFNCGLVAMRSKKFVHNWLVDCFSVQFDRMQYREQDILNIFCYFGNYNVRCLDHPDLLAKNKNVGWWGIIGKSEWNRAIISGDKIIVPKGLGDTPYPPADIEIKVAHLGGGAGSKKDNWADYFPSDVWEWITKNILK